MGFVFFSTCVEACSSMAACNNLDHPRGQINNSLFNHLHFNVWFQVMDWLNCHHLLSFRVGARAGSMKQAGEALTFPHALSAQLRA